MFLRCIGSTRRHRYGLNSSRCSAELPRRLLHSRQRVPGVYVTRRQRISQAKGRLIRKDEWDGGSNREESSWTNSNQRRRLLGNNAPSKHEAGVSDRDLVRSAHDHARLSVLSLPRLAIIQETMKVNARHEQISCNSVVVYHREARSESIT